MSADAASLALEEVTVVLGGRAVLERVSLALAPGEQAAVVGPSGAGKTTLLRLLNATVKPASGSVLLDGRRLDTLEGAALRSARARVGFVHQDHALVPNLRVSQNVLAGRLGRTGFWGAARSMVWPPREELLGVHALLERVGIEEKLFERADHLSGGQQQRVAIARALWQEPALLVADEPVASVDPARARDVVRLLTELAAERGIGLVVSLHDLALAREFFPRMLGLRAGRLVLDRPTAAVTAEEFRALYALGAEGGEAAPGERP